MSDAIRLFQSIKDLTVCIKKMEDENKDLRLRLASYDLQWPHAGTPTKYVNVNGKWVKA